MAAEATYSGLGAQKTDRAEAAHNALRRPTTRAAREPELFQQKTSKPRTSNFKVEIQIKKNPPLPTTFTHSTEPPLPSSSLPPYLPPLHPFHTTPPLPTTVTRPTEPPAPPTTNHHHHTHHFQLPTTHTATTITSFSFVSLVNS